MRTILAFVSFLTLLGAALDKMADVSVAWDRRKAAIVADARASGAEQFAGNNEGYGHERVHQMVGESEYASGTVQHQNRVARTKRLLEGLPLNPTAESDGKWVRTDGLVPAWHGPH